MSASRQTKTGFQLTVVPTGTTKATLGTLVDSTNEKEDVGPFERSEHWTERFTQAEVAAFALLAVAGAASHSMTRLRKLEKFIETGNADPGLEYLGESRESFIEGILSGSLITLWRNVNNYT